MLRKNHRTRRGAWRINTAQAIILLIAVGCIYAVYSAYQKSQIDDTALVAPAAPPNVDPAHIRYANEVKKLQTKLAAQQITLVWPYNDQESAVRLELPDKVPITLAPWDDKTEAQIAQKAYVDFVNVRRKAKVLSPKTCFVHVFIPSPEAGAAQGSMEEVAQASASGVSSAADLSSTGL